MKQRNRAKSSNSRKPWLKRPDMSSAPINRRVPSHRLQTSVARSVACVLAAMMNRGLVAAGAAVLLAGCDDVSTPVADTQPSFGAHTVADQTYTVGTMIAEWVLPAATGGDAPLRYSLTPQVPGLSFSPSTRTLRGTPTAPGEGVHAMTYRVEDVDGDAATLTFNVRVNPAPVADIQPSFGGRRVADQTYTVGVHIGLLELPKASGGNRPLKATLTPEVPGLSFLPFVPALTGTPAEEAEGVHAMTYRVEDSDGDVARLTFNVRVNPASAADTEPSFGQQTVSDHTFLVGSSIVPLVLPDAGGGNPPLTYSLTPEVPGLWFNPVTLIVGGTPTEAAQGVHAMTYRVEDVDGDFAMLTFELRIDPADTEPSFGASTVSDQAYTVGEAIDPLVLPVASGGEAPLSYRLAPGVPGLTFDPAARVLAGTPSAAGVYSMTYTVEDEDAVSDVLTFTITVKAAPLGFIYERLPDVQQCLTIEAGTSHAYLRNSCADPVLFYYCFPDPQDSLNRLHYTCGTEGEANAHMSHQPYYPGGGFKVWPRGASFRTRGEAFRYAVCHHDTNWFVSDSEGNYGCYNRRRR